MRRAGVTVLFVFGVSSVLSVRAQSVASGAATAVRSDSTALADPGARVSATRPTERLGWMAGCWAYRDSRGRLVEEQWSTPRAGVMFGYSRTTRARSGAPGDTLLLYEATRIDDSPDGAVVFAANPSGQQPDEFR